MGELHVIGGLQDKRSELVGLVGRLEQQLAEHRVSLTHLDVTLRLFDPNLLCRRPTLSSGSGFHGFAPVSAFE